MCGNKHFLQYKLNFPFEFFITNTFPAFILQPNNKTAINYSSLSN